MAEIEAFAKSKKTEPDGDSFAWGCAGMDAVRLRPRIERACRTLLERDGIESRCAWLAMFAGIAKVGKYDLYELAVKLPEDPIQWETVQDTTRATILGRMGDPRGVQVIVEAWKAAIPRAEKQEKRRGSMRAWSMWRQGVAEALGAIGGKDEIPFLEEQAKATKDAFVVTAA